MNKRLFAVFMSIIFVMLSIVVCFANDENSLSDEEIMIRELFINYGVEAPFTAIYEILDESDLYSMTRNYNSDMDMACVSMTVMDDAMVYKDILLYSIDEMVSSRALGSDSATYPSSWDERYAIHATAAYEYYQPDNSSTYVRPSYCYFDYEINQVGTSVSYICVTYECENDIYSYPGYEKIGYGIHQIPVEEWNPIENQQYVTFDSFSSDKVFGAFSQGISAGQFLTFVGNVNGSTSQYTVKLW